LERAILREPGWFASPADEYEPECEPLDFFVFTVVTHPSLAALEERVARVEQVSRPFGASLNR
jgi:hypothetical protein